MPGTRLTACGGLVRRETPSSSKAFQGMENVDRAVPKPQGQEEAPCCMQSRPKRRCESRLRRTGTACPMPIRSRGRTKIPSARRGCTTDGWLPGALENEAKEAEGMSRIKERAWGLALLALGMGFMVAGAARGEMAEVLNKAIRICLECIGIG